MLENASQHIACDFDVSQQLWNVPSRACSIAACGWALCVRSNVSLTMSVGLSFEVYICSSAYVQIYACSFVSWALYMCL